MNRPASAINEFYHVYNRGTEKRKIFLSEKDYERFIALLYLCNDADKPAISKFQGRSLLQMLEIERGANLVDISCYCLMPNHFHLLLREAREGGISKFMQKLTTGYTMYFNKRNDRTGALFQGRYKSRHANSDEYLKYLISYIHLNPIKLIDPQWKTNGIKNKKKAEKYLREFKFSSYKDYTGENRPHRKILSTEALPKYAENQSDFEALVKYWLDFNIQGSTSDIRG